MFYRTWGLFVLPHPKIHKVGAERFAQPFIEQLELTK